MPTSLCVCGPSVAVITRLFCSSREYCFYRKLRLFALRFVMIASAFRLLCAPPFCGVCGVRCNSVKWTKKPWIAHGCWFGIRGWIQKKTINFDDFFSEKCSFSDRGKYQIRFWFWCFFHFLSEQPFRFSVRVEYAFWKKRVIMCCVTTLKLMFRQVLCCFVWVRARTTTGVDLLDFCAECARWFWFIGFGRAIWHETRRPVRDVVTMRRLDSKGSAKT